MQLYLISGGETTFEKYDVKRRPQAVGKVENSA